MPKLRHLWPEWEHDERWWIHPLDESARSVPALQSQTPPPEMVAVPGGGDG